MPTIVGKTYGYNSHNQDKGSVHKGNERKNNNKEKPSCFL